MIPNGAMRALKRRKVQVFSSASMNGRYIKVTATLKKKKDWKITHLELEMLVDEVTTDPIWGNPGTIKEGKRPTGTPVPLTITPEVGRPFRIIIYFQKIPIPLNL